MKEEKEPIFNYYTGTPKTVIKSLNRSLSAFLPHYSDIKVGITGRKPKIRFNEQKKYGWKKMVIKYQSTSEAFCNQIEKYFIVTRPELKNYWEGFSHLSKSGYNYLYFIMK